MVMIERRVIIWVVRRKQIRVYGSVSEPMQVMIVGIANRPVLVNLPLYPLRSAKDNIIHVISKEAEEVLRRLTNVIRRD